MCVGVAAPIYVLFYNILEAKLLLENWNAAAN